jgi:ArsR family transcriptional regulator
VSPKAVIDHLRRLEAAGLVANRETDGRRKYFRIARSCRLEVTVTPYGFGTKSAYPTETTPDGTGRYLSVDVPTASEDPDPSDFAAELRRLQELEDELSLAQRQVQGRLTAVLDRITEAVDEEHLCTDVLQAFDGTGQSVEAIARTVDAPVPVVADALDDMRDRGLVRRDGDGWRLPS